MKCEPQVIRETWRVRTDFERIAGCIRYVNDQTTDRAGFLVHKILFLVLNSRIYCGRSPHGERGLKFATYLAKANDASSLPTRGAWIEILPQRHRFSRTRRRSPHGERGLKFGQLGAGLLGILVAPHTGSVD